MDNFGQMWAGPEKHPVLSVYRKLTKNVTNNKSLYEKHLVLIYPHDKEMLLQEM